MNTFQKVVLVSIFTVMMVIATSGMVFAQFDGSGLSPADASSMQFLEAPEFITTTCVGTTYCTDRNEFTSCVTDYTSCPAPKSTNSCAGIKTYTTNACNPGEVGAGREYSYTATDCNVWGSAVLELNGCVPDVPDLIAGGIGWNNNGGTPVNLSGKTLTWGASNFIIGPAFNYGPGAVKTTYQALYQYDSNNDGYPETSHQVTMQANPIHTWLWGPWDLWSSADITTTGNHQVRLCVDFNLSGVGTIAETNENNNCGPWVPFTVVCPAGMVGNGAGGCMTPNSPPVGYVDSAICNAGVNGWAYDPDSPTSPITVHLYRDGVYKIGTFIGQYSTDVYRSDVNALSSTLTGNHGFSIPIPASSKDGLSHSYYVYGIDTINGPPTLLNYSGDPAHAVVTCQAPVWTTYCTRGINSDPANNWTYWQYDDSNPINYRYYSAGDANCQAPINGACSATHYACTAGTSGSPASNTDTWTWSCAGISGGNSANCTENKTWSAPYCNGSGNADPANNWTYWENTTNTNPIEYKKVGAGDANCAPAAPTSISNTCSVSGTSVTLSWPASVGATSYYPRISTSGSCPAGWGTDNTTCYINGLNAQSVLVPITPGTYYRAWVHSGDPVNYNAVASTGFTCQAPVPTATLTVLPNPIASGARATITWASTNVTSCTAGGAWGNGGSLLGSGLSDSLTQDTTFTFQCTGLGGTTLLQSVTVKVITVDFHGHGCTLPADGSGCNISSYWTVTGLPTGETLDVVITGPGLTALIKHLSTTITEIAQAKTSSIKKLTATILGGKPTTIPSSGPLQQLVTQPGQFNLSLHKHSDNALLGTAIPLVACSFGYTIATDANGKEQCVAPTICPNTGNACSATPNSCGVTASRIVDDGQGNGFGSCICPGIPDSDCVPPTVSCLPLTPTTIRQGDVASFTCKVDSPNPAAAGLKCISKGYRILSSCSGSACNNLQSFTTPPLDSSSVYTYSCYYGSVLESTNTVRFNLNPTIRER
jgi:hypothetical protein